MRCDALVRFDGVTPVPCGQCRQCRINRRAAWAARIELELLAHSANSFLTLTYADAPASTVKRDVQLFLKSLRKSLATAPSEAIGGWRGLRYFCSAELGGRFGRPHYHLVLFGVEATPKMEELCLKAWKRGYVKLLPVRPGAAEYVCKYILKRMQSEESLQGEDRASWALMSRRPGIGRRTLEDLAVKVDTAGILSSSSLGLAYGKPNWTDRSKITSGAVLRLDGRLRPLDRYARGVLFPEKEGVGVARLNTLKNAEERRVGGSFSDVLADAERLLEARMRSQKALRRVRDTVL